MATYRITKLGSRAVVGTDEEPLLICASLEVAHRVVADARLLETLPAKLVFFRRAMRPAEGGDRAARAELRATGSERDFR
jgi:hypothetical protein